MYDPYEILGVDRSDSDQTIRSRYLELVREYPPDQAPKEFAMYRRAFEFTTDPGSLVDRTLFQGGAGEPESIGDLVQDITSQFRSRRIRTQTLLSLHK